MTTLCLQIPDEAFKALKLPPGRAEEELRQEFAVFLVKEGLLGPAQARTVAKMDRLEFRGQYMYCARQSLGEGDDAKGWGLSDDTAAAAQRRKQIGLSVHGTLGILLRAIRRHQRDPRSIAVLLRTLPSQSTLHVRPGLLNESIAEVERVAD